MGNGIWGIRTENRKQKIGLGFGQKYVVTWVLVKMGVRKYDPLPSGNEFTKSCVLPNPLLSKTINFNKSFLLNGCFASQVPVVHEQLVTTVVCSRSFIAVNDTPGARQSDPRDGHGVP